VSSVLPDRIGSVNGLMRRRLIIVVLVAGVLTCLVVERFKLFGFGAPIPKAARDILVEFENVPDLLEFAALHERLTEILGRPVDLTTPQALRQHLRSRILDEVRYAA